jgi:hypothetical protein
MINKVSANIKKVKLKKHSLREERDYKQKLDNKNLKNNKPVDKDSAIVL